MRGKMVTVDKFKLEELIENETLEIGMGEFDASEQLIGTHHDGESFYQVQLIITRDEDNFIDGDEGYHPLVEF